MEPNRDCSLGTRRAVALLAVVLAQGAACQGPDAMESDPMSGALRGQIERFVLDRDDGTSETQYFLQLRDGNQRRLIFDRDPRLDPDTRVAVWGRPTGGAFSVSSLAVEQSAAPTEARTSALIGATPATPRKFAFILVDTGA